MRNRRTPAVWGAVFFLYFFAVAIPTAHAYIDPGTGSYVFQVLIGALLGAAVAVKLFWRRVWRFVTRRPKAGPAGARAKRERPAAEHEPARDD